MVSFQPLRKMDVLEITLWKYGPPHDIYNHRPEEREQDIRYMLDPLNGFFSIRAGGGELIGFCSFGKDAQVSGGDYGGDALDTGLGIRPDITGRGMGIRIIGEVLGFAERQFRPAEYRVTIAAFNERALRAWKHAGFIEMQEFHRSGDGRKFIILTRKSTLDTGEGR